MRNRTLTAAPDGDDGVPETDEQPRTRPECEPGPDRTVTLLDPVVVEGIDVPAQRFPPVWVGGTTVVDGFVVVGTHVPSQMVDTGCIIEYDAPAGCLGALEITGFEIPGAEIPRVKIPGARIARTEERGVVAPAASIPAASLPPASTPSVSVPSVRTPQVCQIEPDVEGARVASVTRPSLTRPRRCDGGECIDSVQVDSVKIDSVQLPSARADSVQVPSERLPSYRLEGTETDVVEEAEDTSYLAPADVLFEFDQSVLRPDAIPTLQAIAAEIAEAASDAAIRVGGHTDAEGENDYNQQLSEDRARAVADWLTGEAGISADRVATVGHGESAPVAPNARSDGSDDPEGRTKNRRVVISVATG